MPTPKPALRPAEWHTLRATAKPRWILPLLWIEWLWDWAAYGLSYWSFLRVLEYLRGFSVLVGVVLYFSESGARIKQKHYQAWQVINTAQGKGGSGGRIEALQELNHDKVPLVGVDASSAFLQGIRLPHANLLRSDLSAADLRGSDLESADLTFANLNSTNLRGSILKNAVFTNADLSEGDLVGSDLTGANLAQANLTSADLRSANLAGVQWNRIRSIKDANIAGVKFAPEGFVEWAKQNGAVENPQPDE